MGKSMTRNTGQDFLQAFWTAIALVVFSAAISIPAMAQDSTPQESGGLNLGISDKGEMTSAGEAESNEGKMPFYDDDLMKMMKRMAMNLFFVSIAVYIAHKFGRSNTDMVFTFLLMNVMVFFICFALKKLNLELGMALGLFAIFGIIRYRTDAVNVRDMTYLFVVIGLAVINALSNKKTSYSELLFANAFIVCTVGVLEKLLPYELTPQELKAQRHTQQFVCDDLELLKPENRDQLIEHIHDRLGIRAQRVVIKKIDTRLGQGNVTVHYNPEDND